MCKSIRRFKNLPSISKLPVFYLFTIFARFHTWHIEAWVKCIEVLGVKLLLDTSEGFAEALEVDDFAGAEEFDRVSDFRNIADYTQDIIVGRTCLLLCCELIKATLPIVRFPK